MLRAAPLALLLLLSLAVASGASASPSNPWPRRVPDAVVAAIRGFERAPGLDAHVTYVPPAVPSAFAACPPYHAVSGSYAYTVSAYGAACFSRRYMPFDARFADFFASFPDRNGNVDHPIGEAEMEATARRFVAAHYPEPGILALTETSVRPLIHVGPHNTRAPSVEFRFAQVLDNGVKTYNEAVVIVDSTFGSVVSYDAAYYPVTADRTPRIGPTKAAATAIKALALSEAVVTDSTLIVSRPDDAGREALCYALTVQGDAKPGDAGSFATCRAVVDACNGRVLGVER